QRLILFSRNHAGDAEGGVQIRLRARDADLQSGLPERTEPGLKQGNVEPPAAGDRRSPRGANIEMASCDVLFDGCAHGILESLESERQMEMRIEAAMIEAANADGDLTPF